MYATIKEIILRRGILEDCKEMKIKNLLIELLYKRLNLVDRDNNIYFSILSGVAMMLCMSLNTFSSWLIMLIILIAYWIYNVGEMLVYIFYNWKLKKLYQELYKGINTIGSNDIKSPMKFFLVNFIVMLGWSLIALFIS